MLSNRYVFIMKKHYYLTFIIKTDNGIEKISI